MANSSPVVISSDQSALAIAALPTGTNNIGDVDVLTLPALPAGTNVIGALTANQSVNAAQINGITPLMGNGITGTGSQRVTIASDNTAFPVNATLTAETTKLIGTVNISAGQAVNATLTAETTKVIGTVNVSTKATYRASTVIPLVAATTVNVPFANIIGSATKTVTVKRITVSGMSLTAVAYLTINVEKLSSATSAGTSTTLVATPLDSTAAGGTAVVKAYTAGGTKGALVGTLRSWRTLWQATTAAAAGTTSHYEFDFGDIGGSGGVVLRGVAQEIALTFPIVLGSAATIAVSFEWTEE